MPHEVPVRRDASGEIHIVSRAVHIEAADDAENADAPVEAPQKGPAGQRFYLSGAVAVRRHILFPFLLNFSSYSVCASPSAG